MTQTPDAPTTTDQPAAAETLRLPVLSLTDQVVLPGMVVPVELDATAQAAVDAARAGADGRLLLTPRLADRYPSYGTVATIEQLGRLPGGGPAAVLRAEARARIGQGVSGPGAALWVEADLVEARPATDADASKKIEALTEGYRALVVAVLERRNAWQITDPSTLADTAGWSTYLTNEQKRQLLETPDVAARLSVLTGWTREHLAEVGVSDKIRDDVRQGMEKSQREFLLRQQLAAIRKELGEGEPDGAEDCRGRVEAAPLPEKVREAAMREVGKLERASDQSPESGWIRTWLDTVLELPWGERTTDAPSTSTPRGRCSTPTTTAWTTSRTASWSTSRCVRGGRPRDCRSSAGAGPEPCWPSPVPPGSARPPSGRASRGPSGAVSSASPWAASATRPRSAATGAPTSARCPGASSGPSPRPGR